MLGFNSLKLILTYIADTHLVLIVLGNMSTIFAKPCPSATVTTSHTDIALVYGFSAFFTPELPIVVFAFFQSTFLTVIQSFNFFYQTTIDYIIAYGTSRNPHVNTTTGVYLCVLTQIELSTNFDQLQEIYTFSTLYTRGPLVFVCAFMGSV